MRNSFSPSESETLCTFLETPCPFLEKIYPFSGADEEQSVPFSRSPLPAVSFSRWGMMDVCYEGWYRYPCSR